MNLIINGEKKSIPNVKTVDDILLFLKITPTHVMIEHNDKWIRKPFPATTTLAENDRLEIVHFVGGGSSTH